MTLYQLKHRDTLREIERATRNTFDWVAAPRARASWVRRGAPGSNERRGRRPERPALLQRRGGNVVHFFGRKKAVQACLAKIAGYEAGKPPDRSLLTNTENYVTCLYAAGLQIHSISYVWNFAAEPPARRLRCLQGHAARRRLGWGGLRRAGEAQGAARGPRRYRSGRAGPAAAQGARVLLQGRARRRARRRQGRARPGPRAGQGARRAPVIGARLESGLHNKLDAGGAPRRVHNSTAPTFHDTPKTPEPRGTLVRSIDLSRDVPQCDRVRAGWTPAQPRLARCSKQASAHIIAAGRRNRCLGERSSNQARRTRSPQ